jgi:HK97 family phage major capsid protein
MTFIDELTSQRQTALAVAQNILAAASAENRRTLTAEENRRFDAARDDIERINDRLAEIGEDMERRNAIDANPLLAAIRGKPRGGRGPRAGSAGALCPLWFDPEEMRAAHTRIAHGESAIMEARPFVSGDSLLPPELFPIPTFPRHEDRLADKLRGFAMDAPSLEFVQVNTVSGTAQIVGEGQPKPEITMPATKLIVTALKLACHAGISWENINDYDAFTTAVRTELLKKIVDLENAQLWGGDPAAGGLNSLTKTAGILTLAATGTGASPPNNFDDIAGGIAALRTGPALATPDLLLLHPNTWASIRTQKDNYGRYLATPDPTEETNETVWGVDVLQSTEFTAGEGVLLDSTLAGYVAVRETLILRVGYAGTDFTDNILRSVAEERLNLAVERPAAICHITGLPNG